MWDHIGAGTRRLEEILLRTHRAIAEQDRLMQAIAAEETYHRARP